MCLLAWEHKFCFPAPTRMCVCVCVYTRTPLYTMAWEHLFSSPLSDPMLLEGSGVVYHGINVALPHSCTCARVSTFASSYTSVACVCTVWYVPRSERTRVFLCWRKPLHWCTSDKRSTLSFSPSSHIKQSNTAIWCTLISVSRVTLNNGERCRFQQTQNVSSKMVGVLLDQCWADGH